jgi:MoaA/NifB/PqqE/SkfB family radical SAM enzyme
MTLIDDAARMEARGIVLTGGEVTIRPDFEVLLQHAVERRLSPIIHSNGRVFANRDLAARIAALPGVSFVVSLHASRADIHDYVTQRWGSFDQTCRGLRNLHDFHSVVVTKLVLLRHNRHEIVPTVTLASQLGASEFCLAFPYAARHQMSGLLRYSEVTEEIRAGCLHAEAIGLLMSLETIPYCIVPEMPQMWRQNCDLFRANRTHRLSTDDTLLSTPSSDWDQLRPAMKVKRATCRACVFDPICEGPWRDYVAAFEFDEFVPIGPEYVTTLISLAETSVPSDP